MPVGLEVFKEDSTKLISLTEYYGKIVGSLDIVLPSGWANRFQTGTIINAAFAEGEPFSFFVPWSEQPSGGAVGGGTSYCYICPIVTFSGATLTWKYVRDTSTEFAWNVFQDGPANGRLFYGVY